MSFTISPSVLAKTKSASLEDLRGRIERLAMRERDVNISATQLSNDDLIDLASAAKECGDGKSVRAAEAVLAARQGVFDKPVPNFKAFMEMLRAFLLKDALDGWVYLEDKDGRLYPQLVTGVRFEEPNLTRGRSDPAVVVETIFYGVKREGSRPSLGVVHCSHSFYPHDVAKKRLADALAAKRLYKETPILRADYDASMERYRRDVADGFSKQYRLSGRVLNIEGNYSGAGNSIDGHRVIHDLEAGEGGAFTAYEESFLFDADAGELGCVPEHPVVRVFDLKTHDFVWSHSDALTPYAYDKSLRDKLVLPKTHRDLLDVLTSDLDAFVGDMIEGKSAGNVILCKGIAGVGKTLTAEVYAELIEKPMYSIHAGVLGVAPDEVERNLRMVFDRARRWQCVLLLDEADVFVVRRGVNLEQNAIVADFLRTMEYFDGLMFMTTNRPDDIDEAVISRCAAIIEYEAPDAGDARAIWGVMAGMFEVNLGQQLIDDLLKLFPGIVPRDIKMLLRLALRVAKSDGAELTVEVFRRCAMFRAIKMAAA